MRVSSASTDGWFERAVGESERAVGESSSRKSDSGRITHALLDSLGHTTNLLTLILFIQEPTVNLTREEVRTKIESHKEALRVDYPQITRKGKLEDQPVVRRIRAGKESVNFWLDKFEDNGMLRKHNTNPVRFELSDTQLSDTHKSIKTLLNSSHKDKPERMLHAKNRIQTGGCA
jgi:hypothetical protein